MRKIRYLPGLWGKYNALPAPVKIEIGIFLTLAARNPYDPLVIGPAFTRVDSHARCESTLGSGYRVLWTIGSLENQETIDLFDVLPPAQS